MYSAIPRSSCRRATWAEVSREEDISLSVFHAVNEKSTDRIKR
jgi:hypothetical protein